MHHEKLVVSLRKSGSQNFYLEKQGKVYIPSGEEYEIYVKNLNTVNALVTFEIDGKNAYGDGETFYIRAGETFSLKGDKLNRAFRFIKKTAKISKHRGDKIDDGILRVSYQFEVPEPEKKVVDHVTHHYYDNYYWPRPWYNRHYYWNNDYCGSGFTASSGALRGSSIGSMSFNNATATLNSPSASVAPTEDVAGITVQGSEIQQSFHTVTAKELQPTKHCIVLQLLIETSEGKPVEKNLTSRTRKTCKICGKRNTAGARFCSECSAAIL